MLLLKGIAHLLKGEEGPRQGDFHWMGLFDSIFENGAVYSTNKQVNYEDKRLFVIWILFSLVFPAYLVHEALINQSYQGK